MNKQKIRQHLRKTFSQRHIIMSLACALSLFSAQETWALACKASMSDINFGKVNVIDPNQSAVISSTITVSCTSDSWFEFGTTKANVCLAIDSGSAVQQKSQINPRFLCENGSCNTNNNRLAFNLYTDPNYNNIWGSPNYAIKNTINTIVSVPRYQTKETEVTVYAKLTEPLSKVHPGIYNNLFSEGSTALVYETTNSDTPKDCTTNLQPIRFTFNVLAEVEKNCIINKPQDIAFGTVNSSATNLQGQTAVNVTCTQGVPYNVKLEPSNKNTNGSGEMASTRAGNPDKVPYQLRSGSGMNGKIWGNIALGASSNTISGNGHGSATEHKIYATVPSTDYRAGDYRDTVTVKVDY
ncbi:Csu type fimbrial protein [Neisseria zalophi]|nr:spore coat U domain-containing protein [Neisseria zalophi]